MCKTIVVTDEMLDAGALYFKKNFWYWCNPDNELEEDPRQLAKDIYLLMENARLSNHAPRSDSEEDTSL